jgi:hypothetical protein
MAEFNVQEFQSDLHESQLWDSGFKSQGRAEGATLGDGRRFLFRPGTGCGACYLRLNPAWG